MTSLDFWIGTVIAVLMAIGFTRLSSGRSLIVTFVPGVAVSWLVMLWMFLADIGLPGADDFMPYFLAALVIQCLHFAEEFRTDFKTFFPNLYGGTAYSDNLFVTFNMAAYAVFTTCAVAVFYLHAGYLLMPAMFFIVYGAIGNAISHTVWSAVARAYRPGLITAQAYWIIGPYALYKLTGSLVATTITCLGFAAVLLITLNFPTTRAARHISPAAT